MIPESLAGMEFRDVEPLSAGANFGISNFGQSIHIMPLRPQIYGRLTDIILKT